MSTFILTPGTSKGIISPETLNLNLTLPSERLSPSFILYSNPINPPLPESLRGSINPFTSPHISPAVAQSTVTLSRSPAFIIALRSTSMPFRMIRPI